MGVRAGVPDYALTLQMMDEMWVSYFTQGLITQRNPHFIISRSRIGSMACNSTCPRWECATSKTLPRACPGLQAAIPAAPSTRRRRRTYRGIGDGRGVVLETPEAFASLYSEGRGTLLL